MESLNLKQFKEAIATEAVIQFSATWCGPCKALTQAIESNQESFETKIYKVDIDALPDLAQVLGIRSVPTLIRFFEGEEVTRTTGLQSLDNLIEFTKA